jgi:8-oxo-dGTP pyrophosphatase MutT (NUDIX family)
MLPISAANPPSSFSARYVNWYRRAQESPPENGRALYIAGVRCGWATYAACEALRSLAQVDVLPNALRVGIGLVPGPSLNALLARVAQALGDAQCLRGWRNELLDVLTDEQHLGVIERSAARPLGLLTKAVHLNAWTPDGKLWIARRALNKSIDPGMWDPLVGGLAGSGESLEQALLRECAEEAGLDAASIKRRLPLRTILRVHRRVPEGYQVEDVLTSTCILAPESQPQNRDGEVMEIITVEVQEVLRRIDRGEFTLEAALVIIEDMMQRQMVGWPELGAYLDQLGSKSIGKTAHLGNSEGTAHFL